MVVLRRSSWHSKLLNEEDTNSFGNITTRGKRSISGSRDTSAYHRCIETVNVQGTAEPDVQSSGSLLRNTTASQSERMIGDSKIVGRLVAYDASVRLISRCMSDVFENDHFFHKLGQYDLVRRLRSVSGYMIFTISGTLISIEPQQIDSISHSTKSRCRGDFHPAACCSIHSGSGLTNQRIQCVLS